jgi:hypothetical protein
MREASNTFWTITAWEDAETMNTFRTSGAHRAAMPKLLGWCDEASVVHWNQETAQLPTWLEAHQRMVGEGRLSKVNRPSPAQSVAKIPAPQPSRVQQTLKPARSPHGSAAP